ncbi:MAG: hypothetical protein AAGA20_24200 [Planctomycetota bacterium]
MKGTPLNEARPDEQTVRGPRPAQPLANEIGSALTLLYAPSLLGGLLAGVTEKPDVLREFILLLPLVPVAIPSIGAATLWPALGLGDRASAVAGYVVAAGLGAAAVQVARRVQMASSPSRIVLQAAIALALVLQAWLVVTVSIEMS